MSERIRVLTLVAGLAIGQPGGGAERFGVELARHLDRACFEPIVCGFWRRGLPAETHWRNFLTSSGVDTFFAADRGKAFTPGSYVGGLRNIASILQGRPVDIIHSHFQLGTIAALVLRRALSARALLRTAHGTVNREWGNTPLGLTGRQLFTRYIFPLALNVEVGVSGDVVASLDARSGARLAHKRAQLIFNGISPDRFETAVDTRGVRSDLGLPPKGPVIGGVGRLSEQKGYIYLLRALPEVMAAWPSIRLILVGDGELRQSLEAETARLGISEAVRFVGARQDVDRLYHVMDLLVLPSLWEGLPTVVLEAMASGIPVVATDIPGTRDLVQDKRTGWLAPAADPGGLARAILAGLSDADERAEVAHRAAIEVAPHYSLKNIARQYEELYARILTRQSPDLP